MSDVDRKTFSSVLVPDHERIVGVHDLWVQEPDVQADVLAQAMERFEGISGVSLAMLGFTRTRAVDLVSVNRFRGSELSDKDILACVMMGNLEFFPAWGLNAVTLGPRSLDCGVWDGVWGEPGNYFQQRNGGVSVINPGDPECVDEMWEGPLKFPRASELGKRDRHLNLTNAAEDDGVLLMLPGVAYLFGVWPAVRTDGLDLTLETRSNAARWAMAAAVNSTGTHKDYNGVITAEGTTFAHRPLILNTNGLPWQMVFSVVNPTLEREPVLTFSGQKEQGLEEAAREFQNDPRKKMLPRAIVRQRAVIENVYGGK